MAIAYRLASSRTTSFGLLPGDSLVVTFEGSIYTHDPAAIASSSGIALTINGTVHSQAANGYGIDLSGGNNSIAIGVTGIVSGDVGVRVGGTGSSFQSSGTLYSMTGNALAFTGSHNTITLNATSNVRGATTGVYSFGGFNSFVNAGNVASFASGVWFSNGGNTISNSGNIFSLDGSSLSSESGLLLLGAGVNTILNTGTIHGHSGIHANTSVILTNSGTIAGFAVGVSVLATVDLVSSTVVNNGYIIGRLNAGITLGDSLGAAGGDLVVNNGFVQGRSVAISLAHGNDFFDGRNGIQVGTVDGGFANDVLYGGASFDDLRGGPGNDHIHGGPSADYLDGETDFDLVRYDFAAAAVTVSLANPAINSGEAAGDVLLNFEGIVGSGFADVLIGNGAANILIGGLGGDSIAAGAGVDTILGGDGADVLFGEADGDLITGGAGGDIIRGGLGGDLIVFNAGDNGDLIINFNEGGVRDGFDLRGYFDAAGFTGADPRAAGIMQVLQNGADTDVYLHGAFAFRIQGVVAAAIDNSYFMFQ